MMTSNMLCKIENFIAIKQYKNVATSTKSMLSNAGTDPWSVDAPDAKAPIAIAYNLEICHRSFAGSCERSEENSEKIKVPSTSILKIG